MSGCWRRLRQGSERELPERAALFLHPVHLRGELSRAARGGWQRLLALHGTKGGILFPKRIPPFEPPRERRGESPSTPALAVGRLKDCLRCAIRCLLSDVSIRFELLLSSLPLCLRFGSLMQFPPTLDVISPASACQGAALLRSPRFWDTKKTTASTVGFILEANFSKHSQCTG